MSNEMICFALCRPILSRLCSSLSGTSVAEIEAHRKPGGYYPPCKDCELVRHGALLENYPADAPARKVFAEKPELLEELYRNAYEFYIVACDNCFRVYKVFSDTAPLGEGEESALCPHCHSALPALGSCEFTDIGLSS